MFVGIDGLMVVVVIVVAVLLLSFVLRRVKKSNIQQQIQAKVNAGRAFELKVGKVYEERGYEVDYRGVRLGVADGGIDLIAKNSDEVVLIQCKYWTTNKIDLKTVRIFFGDCFAHIWQQKIPYEKVRCVMAVPSRDSLETPAIMRFVENSSKMRYEVVG